MLSWCDGANRSGRCSAMNHVSSYISRSNHRCAALHLKEQLEAVWLEYFGGLMMLLSARFGEVSCQRPGLALARTRTVVY